MMIRNERTGDEDEVDQIITAAFANHPHSDQREGWIAKRPRAGNALTLSLVADEYGQVAGHIAFSPVQIDGAGDGKRDGMNLAPATEYRACFQYSLRPFFFCPIGFFRAVAQ